MNRKKVNLHIFSKKENFIVVVRDSRIKEVTSVLLSLELTQEYVKPRKLG